MTRKEKKQRMAALNKLIIDRFVYNINLIALKNCKCCNGAKLANAVEGSVNILFAEYKDNASFMPYHQYVNLVIERASVIAGNLNTILECGKSKGLVT